MSEGHEDRHVERQLAEILAILQSLSKGHHTLMSAVSDFANKVNANFASIQSGIASLDAQIQAFQNSPGTLSPSDQAALDAIAAQSAILAAAAQAPVTPPVPAA
jgi:hypothetical protein